MVDFIKKHKYILLFVLLAVLSSAGQLYKIDRDFNGLNEYEPAQKTLLARNLLELGPQKSKLGPVNNINPLNGKLNYYLYHPFLDMYVYAFFFKFLGTAILPGRLLSIILFCFSAFCLFMLARRIWGQEVALYSCFFYFFFPLSQYYGKMVNVFNILLPLIFLFLLFYYEWAKKKERKYFYFMLLAFVLACAVDWYAYFLAPLAVWHYRYVLKQKGRGIFALILAGLAIFGVFLSANYFLTGSVLAAQAQWPAGLHDPSLSVENVGLLEHALGTRAKFDLLIKPSFYWLVISFMALCFTWPVVLVLFSLIFSKKVRGGAGPLSYIWLGALPYFGYGLLNPKTIPDHIVLMALLSAAMAVTVAVFVKKVSSRWRAAFIIIFLLFSVFNLKTFYTKNDTNQKNFIIGKAIAALTEEKDDIAVSQAFYSPNIEYYGRRRVLYGVFTRSRLDFALKSGRIDHLVTDFNSYKRLLVNKYPVTFLPYGLAMFDLTSKDRVRFKHYVKFANNLRLINYSFDRLPDDYLLLKYDWEKGGRSSEQFKIFVHFHDQDGKYVMGQDHYMLNGLVDLTRPGYEILREAYYIKLPDNLRGKQLDVYVGLYSTRSGVRVGLLNRRTRDRRVFLGTI